MSPVSNHGGIAAGQRLAQSRDSGASLCDVITAELGQHIGLARSGLLQPSEDVAI
jgi:hypothetical protein